MIPDLVRAPADRVAEDDQDERADAAAIFAVFSALHASELEGDNVEVVDRARQTFLAGLDQLGLDEVALFEHIAQHLSMGDWEGLGLPPPEH